MSKEVRLRSNCINPPLQMSNPSCPKASSCKHRLHVLGLPAGDLHGHVNPMLCFITTLISRHDKIHATIVVTDAWLQSASTLTLLSAATATDRIKFATLESVPPASGGAVDDLPGFHETVKREMVAPLEKLLDQMDPPVDLIVADGFLGWAVEMGRRRKVAVSSFWPASAALFSLVLHQSVVFNACSFPLDLRLCGEDRLDLIPGIPSIRLADLPGEFQTYDEQILCIITTAITKATEAQCIIFRTTNELEQAALSALKTAISIPIYPIGPTIPYFTLNQEYDQNTPKDYIKWLDSQQPRSVLYVSLGTCLPTLSTHVDELAIAVRESGIPFLWVAREEVSRVSQIVGGKMGKVVSWCDQMRVLMHPCIGGFVSHCGWNSTVEAAFSGVPALAFPTGIDQTLNSKIMVEDWGIGWRLNSNFQELVEWEKILVMLNKFMDLESVERKELDDKCKRFKERILVGVGEDGSTSNLDEFIFNIDRHLVKLD